jgi:FAD/FMN-containing dehydrogenase/Fe-S oxidoreductase
MTNDLEAELRRAVSGEIRADPYTRHLYARDASMYSIVPRCVVFPRDAADAVAVIAVARQAGVPVLARGAGTSLAGQTVGPGVVMDFSRHMHEVLSIDPGARLARVQPGVVQEQLNRAAARHGLMLGPDTSTANRATLGGMIGNNSAGSGSVRYGSTIDHVESLEVVLADGSPATLTDQRAAMVPSRSVEGLSGIVERYRDAISTGYPGYWRQSGGYRLDRLAGGDWNLARFVTGSEGTLVVVTEATVALVPVPAHRVMAVGHFTSAQAAIEATSDALACEPAAVELIDKMILDLSRSKIEYQALGSILHGDPDALLFVTFTGDTEAEAVAGLDRLEARWRRGGHGYHVLRAVTDSEQGAVTKVRSAGLGLLMAASTGTRRPHAFVEDTAVDPARLAEYVPRFKAILDRHGLRAGFYGHCSVGCLHVRPFVDLAVPADRDAMRAVAGEVRELVAEFGGVNSSEHGDGLARSEFNRAMFGDALYEAMREVKRLFDPENVLNPGKITDAPPMTSHLAIPRALSPAATGHEMLAGADRCMNIGLCRKTASGVMCPSYMVTREEEHSTRGRANALVKALSSADPATALGDERLHGILDLCLECKACKSECPLGVDMATLKVQALAAYQERHGVPVRSRVFGSIRALNRVGSAVAPVANLVAPLGKRFAGIAGSRPLPRFRRQNVVRWAARRPASPGGRPLVFLADCFTTYTDTGVARAAIELLELAGYQVRLEHAGCCGRASLSKGLLTSARRQAAALTGRLPEGVPVTGVEPSCVLTLRDEYPSLLGVVPPGAVRLADELIAEAIASGIIVVPVANPLAGRRIVFHGHCHQKAVTGTSATMSLLRAIPGAEVVELDAGCCGMAGSFGFEAEHYDVSMSIGELRLFPALRAQPPGTTVAATGVSCRQQILHGTGRAAVHPLQLLRQAMSALDQRA